jgi:pimeloyl-ACP methyl ester carboxylesterase
MRDSTIVVSGGRKLAYTDLGSSGWPCVFFFHGAPMSRLHLAYLEERFVAEQVRLIAPDRPAYGGSTPHPGRLMSDWPRDVAVLADALGITHFMVAGHSSGGPYAAACSALLPERVIGGIVLGGVTDMGWRGAWEGYVESECELMRLPDESAALAWCTQRYGPDGSGFHEASDFEFAAPDNVLFADDQAGPAIMTAVGEAFRQGVAGYAQDLFVQGRPWPFAASGIAAPMQVLHGELDDLLPLAHSRHTAELIPDATLQVLPGHGHMTIVAELPSLASTLARA